MVHTIEELRSECKRLIKDSKGAIGPGEAAIMSLLMNIIQEVRDLHICNDANVGKHHADE